MLLASLLLLAVPVDRATAIDRALDFLDRTASQPVHLERFGHDLLWSFSSVARTSRDPELQRKAAAMGQRHAKAWRAEHARLAKASSAVEIANLAMGDHAASTLGVRDAQFNQALVGAAKGYSSLDYHGYDVSERPPNFDVWSDALIATYFGDAAGVQLGVGYAAIAARPPPLTKCTGNDVFYALTHVIYTRNDYGQKKLRADQLARETGCIRQHLGRALKVRDPEIIGESVDTLRALGLGGDPNVAKGVAYLLRNQRDDGTWAGDASDVYTQYHSAWTGLDALREYAY